MAVRVCWSDRESQGFTEGSNFWKAQVAKPVALPGDDGVRFDEEQVCAPAGPHSGQIGPEDAVSRCDVGPPAGPLVDGELMAQGEHFELQRYSRAEGCEEPANEEEQKGAHGGLAKGACPAIITA